MSPTLIGIKDLKELVVSHFLVTTFMRAFESGFHVRHDTLDGENICTQDRECFTKRS